jgi:photoactive yellow protein
MWFSDIYKLFEKHSNPNHLHALVEMSPEELDVLPVGAIRLGRDGTVLGYNQAESRLSGLLAERVLGRNFFTEIAPCTNVREFAGEFHEGIKRGELYAVFPFLFNFRPPKLVTVTMYLYKPSGNVWVLVKSDPAQSTAPS